MFWFAVFLGGVAGLGLLQALCGLYAVRRFRTRYPARFDAPILASSGLPGVTVLKPLYGDEPLLEAALASFCAQDYPNYQIIFGVRDPADLALHVVRRLQKRFPACDIAVVVDETLHGANRKISNLINMYPLARHSVIVVADADVHVAVDYLRRIVAALDETGTGLVTTLYTGMPAGRGLAPLLGTSQISHVFLPGALMARGLGRQDCLGATMALRRETLLAIGGFSALVGHLADDAMLGRLVGERGLAVRLAGTVPATTVSDRSLRALFQHELRWARTIHSITPVGFALSGVQYPLFWAMVATMVSGGGGWFCLLFVTTWGLRAVTARGIDRALGLERAVPAWLLPFRDLLSVVVMLASYRNDHVHWRGQTLRADRRGLRAATLYTPAERIDAI
jgi:ceramide glucosyltransferase